MSQVSRHTGHIKPRNWWACPQLAYTRYIMTSAESCQWQDVRNYGRVHFLWQKWKKFWRSWKVLLTLFACYLSCCCLVVSAPPNGLYLPPLHWHQVFTHFGALRIIFLQPEIYFQKKHWGALFCNPREFEGWGMIASILFPLIRRDFQLWDSPINLHINHSFH